jgi:hypothetical protein
MASIITYEFPVTGTTPPAIGWGGNTVTGVVNFLDADTTLLVTHGFNLLAADLASLFPIVIQSPTASNAGSGVGAQLQLALTDSNHITLSKTGATGTGGTWNLSILRPYMR